MADIIIFPSGFPVIVASALSVKEKVNAIS